MTQQPNLRNHLPINQGCAKYLTNHGEVAFRPFFLIKKDQKIKPARTEWYIRAGLLKNLAEIFISGAKQNKAV